MNPKTLAQSPHTISRMTNTSNRSAHTQGRPSLTPDRLSYPVDGHYPIPTPSRAPSRQFMTPTKEYMHTRNSTTSKNTTLKSRKTELTGDFSRTRQTHEQLPTMEQQNLSTNTTQNVYDQAKNKYPERNVQRKKKTKRSGGGRKDRKGKRKTRERNDRNDENHENNRRKARWA